MQTFLPFPDFSESAAVLDRQRLGKQRVECLQLLRAMQGDGGWSRHPACLMWRGHGRALVRYGLAVCAEWTGRGYRDTCAGKILAEAALLPGSELDADPPWLGDPALHLSHRSNLLRKDAAHYGPLLEAGLRDDLPYEWPAVP